MYDRFNREINYLRISVTDRCNLRCHYCMPAEGVSLKKHDEILSFEEIVELVKYGVDNGVTKVRLTGGEPLVRKGIVDLVKQLSAISGLEEVSMTTNGVLLKQCAQQLKDAGLKRVNISLDSVRPDDFAKITGGGDIQDVFDGVDAALVAKLHPIKLNCVVWKSSDEMNAKEVKEYANSKGIKVRFIHQMNLKTGEFSVVEGGEGGNCQSCNRLRLTADGLFKPCLFSDKSFSVRKLGVKEAFKAAIKSKPNKGSKSDSNEFYNIGG